VEQQERMQVTHYHPGERYAPHFDALGASGLDTGESGDRVCTVILYLNDDFAGGETVFPRLFRRFRPAKGKALVFTNLTADGTRHDPLSIHAGGRVRAGEKWLANQWIRQHDRHRAVPARGVGGPRRGRRS
jgi:prolyl 4-hydroxylase